MTRPKPPVNPLGPVLLAVAAVVFLGAAYLVLGIGKDALLYAISAFAAFSLPLLSSLEWPELILWRLTSTCPAPGAHSSEYFRFDPTETSSCLIIRPEDIWSDSRRSLSWVKTGNTRWSAPLEPDRLKLNAKYYSGHSKDDNNGQN